MQVKAKKFLGQHFLKDEHIAQEIVKCFVEPNAANAVLEVGPGMGVLTKYLLVQPNLTTWAAEVDDESITWLCAHYPQMSERLLHESFLSLDFNRFNSSQIGVIGNFPYNISSQIVFKVIEERHQVPIMVGMFQKEVAERICAKPGNKDYGILSVITQAYYHTEYLFTVPPEVFNPPPKVNSGVIRLSRLKTPLVNNEALFKQVVKTAFNQRRKKLRNALNVYNLTDEMLEPYTNLRAENLSVTDFVALTERISAS